MKQICIIWIAWVMNAFLFSASAQCNIDSLFASVPRKVMPLFERTSKLDMLDLYNNNLPAKAENQYGGQSEMLVKKSRYIRINTSDSGEWQMRLFTHQNDTVVVCINTVRALGQSSRISVYHLNWSPAKQDVPMPSFADFYAPHKDLSLIRERVLGQMLHEVPVKAEMNDSANAIVFSLSIESLPQCDQTDASLCIHPVVCEWVNGKFVLRKRDSKLLNLKP